MMFLLRRAFNIDSAIFPHPRIASLLHRSLSLLFFARKRLPILLVLEEGALRLVQRESSIAAIVPTLRFKCCGRKKVKESER